VLADIRQDLVTEAAAAADYGVVLAGGEVDRAGTASLRARLAAERGRAEAPRVSWKPWREAGP
jgi:hypothetical protein